MLNYLCDTLKMLNQTLLDSLLNILVVGAACANVYRLFVRVLACFCISCLQACLPYNICLKNGKMQNHLC
jgi:hypothetical protein